MSPSLRSPVRSSRASTSSDESSSSSAAGSLSTALRRLLLPTATAKPTLSQTQHHLLPSPVFLLALEEDPFASVPPSPCSAAGPARIQLVRANSSTSSCPSTTSRPASPTPSLLKSSALFARSLRPSSRPASPAPVPAEQVRLENNSYFPHQTSRSPFSAPSESFASRVDGSADSMINRTNQLEEATCPVCLEALSLRLQGEKPHVVPVCGHRLHEACFEAVYGGACRGPRGTRVSLGVCGVCRREMKLGEEGHSGGNGRNKFAAISGLPQVDRVEPSKSRLHSHRALDPYAPEDDDDDEPPQLVHDPTDDDDLVDLHLSSTFPTAVTSSPGGRLLRPSTASTITTNSLDSGIVRPIVTVRSEHGTVTRSGVAGMKKNLTCMVTISMPSRWPASSPLSSAERDEGYSSARLPPPTTPRASSMRALEDPTSPRSPFYDSPTTPSSVSNPFLSVIEDLQHRMVDWKGHSLDEFGALKLYDYINVRKDKNVREFLVYLFEEAILCVADDKRKGLASKIVDGISGSGDRLRLKGRIYVRHVRSIIDTSQGGDLTLTVMMQDDALDEFVMSFKSRASLEVWKSQIELLLALNSRSPFATPPLGGRMGPGSRAATSPSITGSMYSNRSSDYRSETSSRSGAQTGSIYSTLSRTTSSSLPPLSTIIPEENSSDLSHFHNPSPTSATSSSAFSQQMSPTLSSGTFPLGGRDFTPLDLMLIFSISANSTLKLGILRSTLDFIVQTVGPRTRISLVTYITGEGNRGVLRKTPFIAVGRPESRKRLDSIIDNLGSEYNVRGGMSEHREENGVNVVTAVDLALDIVLQRKSKSALSGMILMNDGKDGAQKQQMDLVMTRAEAANVPIHTVGWGNSHDPSSLWLLSNHTRGTYTFVKEYYDLRETVAGIIGGILSIAATNVRLHITVPERRWFRIRKVAGTSGAIVSSDGKDVDIDVAELRYGEKKDLIVEVEMEMEPPEEFARPRTTFSATDEYFMNVGLDPLALGEMPVNFYEKEYEGMANEVALFEVNAAYRDVAAGRNISRVSPSPCLLTITVVPPISANNPVRPPVSDPSIVRRRMELLTSDMLTRTLLLMSRHNDAQAQRLLVETKRIILTIAGTLVPRSTDSRTVATPQTIAHAMLTSCAEDVARVLEGVTNRQEFDAGVRNYAAQQAVVLREQRSWTAKSTSERLMWTSDNSRWFACKSQGWTSSR